MFLWSSKAKDHLMGEKKAEFLIYVIYYQHHLAISVKNLFKEMDINKNKLHTTYFFVFAITLQILAKQKQKDWLQITGKRLTVQEL